MFLIRLNCCTFQSSHPLCRQSPSFYSNGCPFDKHFALPGHDFNKHARFTLIEQINDRNMSKSEARRLLEDREDYWMTRLRTLQPEGMNDHLNAALRQTIHAICS